MSKVTDQNKVAEQAKRIDNLTSIAKQLQAMYSQKSIEAKVYLSELETAQSTSRYVLIELYKLKPGHELFDKDPALAEDLKKMVEAQNPVADGDKDNTIVFQQKPKGTAGVEIEK
jgi:hypothetical protein